MGGVRIGFRGEERSRGDNLLMHPSTPPSYTTSKYPFPSNAPVPVGSAVVLVAVRVYRPVVVVGEAPLLGTYLTVLGQLDEPDTSMGTNWPACSEPRTSKP